MLNGIIDDEKRQKRGRRVIAEKKNNFIGQLFSGITYSAGEHSKEDWRGPSNTVVMEPPASLTRILTARSHINSVINWMFLLF